MNQGEKMTTLELKKTPTNPEVSEVVEITPEKALADFENATVETKNKVSENNQSAENIITAYSGAESSDIEAVKGINATVAEGVANAENQASHEIAEIKEEKDNTTTESSVGENREKMVTDMNAKENGYLKKTRQLYTVNTTSEKIKPQFDEIEKSKGVEARTRIEKNVASLENRFNDERSDLENVKKEIENYVGENLTQQLGKDVENLKDKKFDAETSKVLIEQTKRHIESLLGSEGKRNNPEKQKALEVMTENYVNLLLKSQEEGDISKDAKAEDIQKLITENIWKLAYQDRIAAENTLGDHGIRHLVMHNISKTEEIFDQLSKNGQKVGSIDRLMAYQIMINHDMGYAMEPTREAINAGFMSADRGHNVLSAKFIRQQAEDPNNYMSKVFSENQLGTIHQGILEHDKSDIKLKETAKGLGEGTLNEEQARKDNLLDAISIADNSHAFEDKLPEILYSHPDSLEYMRLMKVAGEGGDLELVGTLKEKLKESINKNDSWTADDKEALAHAIDFISADSYKFAVGRIAGNKPKIEIDKEGNLAIKVQESAVHQEVVQLFEQESYNQFHKFITDYIGKPENLDPPATEEEIQSATKEGRVDFKKVIRERMNRGETSIKGRNGINIELAIGENRGAEPDSDLEKNVRKLITKPEFIIYREEDRILEESFKKALKSRDEATAKLLREKRLKLTKEYAEKL